MLKSFFTPKWQHQDAEIRKQALAALDAENDIEIIVKLAKDDPSKKVQELALAKLTNTAVLQSLLSDTQNPGDWCRFAYRLNQLSPRVEALTAKFEKCKDNWDKDETFKAVASNTMDRTLTNSLLSRINDADSLYKIATTARSIELRLKAVEDINDPEQLKKLLKNATHKQVLQIVRNKLAETKSAQKEIDETITRSGNLASVIEKLSKQSWFDPQFELKVGHAVENWRELDLAITESATERHKKDLREYVNRFQSCLKICQELIAKNKQQLEQAAAQQDALDKQNDLCTQMENLLNEMSDPAMNSLQSYQSVQQALDFLNDNWQQTIKESKPETKVFSQYTKLQGQLQRRVSPWENFIRLKPKFELLFNKANFANVSIKEYDVLNDWLKGWQDLYNQLAWSNNATMPNDLNDWFELAKKYQAQYDSLVSSQKKKARYLNQKITLLEKHCQQRNLIAANKLVNYIKQKLNDSISEFHTSLSKKLQNIQPKLDELRDWHAFATSPKKSDLCEVMERLIDEPMEPLTRAKKVRELQRQWRELLASDPNADDQSWERFKKASDSAYQPCLAFYAEKDKVRADNLKNRLNICESLEQLVARYGWNTEAKQQALSEQEITSPSGLDQIHSQPDWKAIDQQINKASQDWKKYQPVPENERESIQNHYNNILSMVRNQLDAEKQTNLESRCQLVEKAIKFYEMEDIEKSIQGVLRLQKQWKELGLTYYKADRVQWKLFRAAIDKVFSKRDSLKKQFKDELLTNQKKLKELTEQIDQLCRIEDEHLKQSYQQFKELKQSWSYDTQLPRASSQVLLKAFENSCSKYKLHYAGLDQRKKQAAFRALQSGAALLNSVEEAFLQGEPSKIEKSNLGAKLEQLKSEIPQLKCNGDGKNHLESRLSQIIDLNKAVIDEMIENQSGLLLLHELALSMEILLAIDSPKSCKEQRMKIQLEQLQKGIGTNRSDVNKSTQVREMYNKWISVGFINQVNRAELEIRREKIFTAAGL